MSIASAGIRPNPPREPVATGVRYGVLVLLALAATSAYLTRICLSVANTTIQAQFGITNTQMGDIISAFFLGYLWFQVPTGWLGTRFGARATMAALSVGASLCSVWSGLALGPGMLYASRVGLGVMQAGLVPCAGRAVLDWFPPEARGKASSAIASCMSLGGVIAQGLTAALIGPLGWRGVFFAYSGVGVVWAIVHYAWFRDLPHQHHQTNAAERKLIRHGRAGLDPGAVSELEPGPTDEEPETAAAPPLAAVPPTKTPRERFHETRRLLLTMASSFSFWMICGQAVFRAFGAAFFLTWFPAYLEKGHGVKLRDTGFLAMLPLMGSVVGALLGGAVVDQLLVRTRSRRWSRSGTGTVAMLLTALSLFLATLAPDPISMVLILSLGNVCFSLSSPASWAATMDISGRHTQFLFAVSNMAGNIGAMACSWVTGRLFDLIEAKGLDWDVVLYVYLGVSLAAASCWALLNPEHPACERPGPASAQTAGARG